ncbi:MAG: AI-2E family transporter [Eubacteriales bacterium]|nr:AI-2E family transporter [Eubacteriales bacterium]
MDSIVKMGVRQAGEAAQKAGAGAERTDLGPSESKAEPLQDPRFLQERSGKSSRQADAAAVPQQPAATQKVSTAATELKKEMALEDTAAAALKTEKEQLAAEERAKLKALKKRCHLIAQYVIATVVISYILLRMTNNLGSIINILGRTAAMIGLLLQPLFWGFVLAYILSPLVDMCEERIKGIPFLNRKGGKRRTKAVAITCVGVVLILTVLLSIIVSAVSRSLRVASLEDMIAMAQSFATTLESFRQTLMARLSAMNIGTMDTGSVLKQIGEKLAQFTGGLSSGLISSAGHIGGFLTNLLFAIIFCIYFLLDGKGLTRYWDRVLLAVCGRKMRRNLHVLAGDADVVFSGYIRGQLIDALIMAVLVSVSLSLIGVRYAVIIGVLSGIGNLIPYVGPVVAYGSSIIVCLLTGDIRRLLVALVVLFVIQTVDGNVINPRLLSTNVDVHPMLVIAALIVGGSIGGLVGMLFAVPVAAFLKIQFDKIVERLLNARVPEKNTGSGRKKSRKGSSRSRSRSTAEKEAAGEPGQRSKNAGKGSRSE